MQDEKQGEEKEKIEGNSEERPKENSSWRTDPRPNIIQKSDRGRGKPKVYSNTNRPNYNQQQRDSNRQHNSDRRFSGREHDSKYYKSDESIPRSQGNVYRNQERSTRNNETFPRRNEGFQFQEHRHRGRGNNKWDNRGRGNYWNNRRQDNRDYGYNKGYSQDKSLDPDAPPFVPTSCMNVETEENWDAEVDNVPIDLSSQQSGTNDINTEKSSLQPDEKSLVDCSTQEISNVSSDSFLPQSATDNINVEVSLTNKRADWNNSSWADDMINETDTVAGVSPGFNEMKLGSQENVASYSQPERYKKSDRNISRKSDEVRNEHGKEREGLNYLEYMRKTCFQPDSYFKIVKEIQGDLMEMPEEYSLAHCVAEDMNMGSGIALQFRKQFKQVSELLTQSAKQGGVAFLKDKDRYIYYLVTKRESNRKPTLDTMFKSVSKLRDHMVDNNVTKLAIPRIGCGLDRLEWSDVKYMLEYIFTGTNVEITVCNFQKAEEKMSETKEAHQSRKCKLVIAEKSITEMERGTLILYIGSEDGTITDEISTLDRKFNIINDYKSKKKTVGSMFCKYCMNYEYALYCVVVKKNASDPFDFINFTTGLKEVNKENRKLAKRGENYSYVAMQELFDPKDDSLTTKIINILRNTLFQVEINICRKLN